MAAGAKPLWEPAAERVAGSRMRAFMNRARGRWDVTFDDYAGCHAWSVARPEQFWLSVWEFCGVIGEPGERVLVGGSGMRDAQWFPDARLNFAENLLRRRDDADALVFWAEDVVRARISHRQLYQAVAQTAAALRSHGVVAGDRVAAYMPNVPATVVIMLAAASIGATFSSASPDFGVQGVLDRFGQIEPRILFACSGYRYNGQWHDCRGKLADIAAGLPTLEARVIVPYLEEAGGSSIVPGWTGLADFLAPHQGATEIEFAPLPFDHPLVIVYSSGTTGVPKCIVHGAGGVLLQHLKEHQIHGDIRLGDRVFYFTTCGWMMWNWLVSALASSATLLLYDGAALFDQGRTLFDFAGAEEMTHFGTSAKFIDAIAKNGLAPARTHDLKALRAIFSTGSPLAPEAFDYVYRDVKRDVHLASISGGTDLLSCFVLGNPVLPVWRGEIQCRGLGMAVEVFDENGHSIEERKGELVCVKPFPSMPLGFWNDADGAKYRAAYFSRFDGAWCHGDYVETTAHGGLIIHGRSDATLNPAGVRIGTAEIYRQVETLPEVAESLVIGQHWGGDVRVVLFVRLQEGLVLDEALAATIRRRLRDNASPHHVPARIVQVADIPRTRSGKIVELAVRNVVHGEPVENVEALANPEALDAFRNRPELQI